jgi:signal transduction histidine kinase
MSVPDAAASTGWHARWHQRARRALAHSLRVRLMALFILLAAAMIAVFLLGMQQALTLGWRDAIRPILSDYVDRLAVEVGTPPSVERAQALASRLPITVRIDGPVVNFRSYPSPYRGFDRRFQVENEPRLGDDGRSEELEGGEWHHNEPHLLERFTADGHRIRFGPNVRFWHDRPRNVGWATLAIILLLTAVAYARVRHLLRPLDDIRKGAMRFGTGDFSQPIPVRHAHHADELGELAATVNTMARDIHQMLEAKRGLLLAISHELRSPLTRARVNTELLPEQPDMKPARDALLRDLGVMRDLIADLLESERLASPHAALQREPTDLATLVTEVVVAMDGGGGAVQRDIAPGLPPLLLDRARMRLLLRNLLDNAQRHNGEAAAPPEIHLQPAELNGRAAVAITVRDHGPGVPEDQLPHLAQPFYRPDAARERATGGVGLGLHLCKLVAQAHGGTFAVRNAGPGLAVVVTLPA